MSNTFYSGFCIIPPLVINGSLSPIGELNSKGMTYAKEPDFYYQKGSPCYLTVFRGVNGDKMYEKIPTSHQNPTLEVCNWLYQQAVNNKFNNSEINCLQQLRAQFTDNYNFKNIGTMITNNQIWLPRHLQFTVTRNNIEHEFKIWFAVENFLEEFPYREIYVFPPLPPAESDSLFKLNYKELQKRLAEETIDRLEDRVHNLLEQEKYPYTTRFIKSYDVYDLINKPEKTLCHWTIVQYGNPKNADEEIEEAIKDCLDKNTTVDNDKKEETIPDLYNPLEYILIPHFNDLGLVNETPKGSTYSPIFDYLNGEQLAYRYADMYTQGHIKEVLQIVPHLYKSLKISAVGKPNNNLGQTRFTDIYPDYQLIPSTDSQAGMMSKETLTYLLEIENLINAAETVTMNNTLPGNIQRVVRKERLYVSLKIGKVKFLMLSRYQLIKDGYIDE